MEVKILQRTIIKYSVPLVSSAVGGSYNYTTTASIGKFAKNHFKNRGVANEELRELVSRRNNYDLVFPAAVRFIAQSDGEFGKTERELYQSILAKMSFEPYEQSEFEALATDEERLIQAIAELGDAEKETLIELLILMATYDGNYAEKEHAFLLKVAELIQYPIDFEAVQARAEEFRLETQDSRWQKLKGGLGTALDSAKQKRGGLFSRPASDENSSIADELS